MSRTPSTRRPSSANRAPIRPKRRPQVKRAPRPGLLDHAVMMIPGGQASMQRIAAWGITGAVLALLIALAAWFGLIAMAGTAIAEGIGEAGFRVKQIDIAGAQRLDRDVVYAAALDQRSRAMPLVDLTAVREKLLANNWVADARVSRRLPDTLSIRITERVPAAVWQNDGQLMLIDPTGKPLAPVSLGAMPPLPILVGEGANDQALGFARLMRTAPSLKPLVHGANWLGARRWTLTFESGEQLLLPEGDSESIRALSKFVALNKTMGLLGHGYRRFDMRNPEQLVVQRGSATSVPLVEPGAKQGSGVDEGAE